MISNLATTVFCCINEMFHFQRDCQDILKTVPSLLCTATPRPPPNKVLCFGFFKRTMALFHILEDNGFQRVLRCLFSTSFLLLLFHDIAPKILFFDSLITKSCQFCGVVKRDSSPLYTEQELLKYCMYCKPLSLFLSVEGGAQGTKYPQQNSLPLLKQAGLFLIARQTISKDCHFIRVLKRTELSLSTRLPDLRAQHFQIIYILIYPADLQTCPECERGSVLFVCLFVCLFVLWLSF